MTDLIKILNNPEEHYPGNFDTPQRANALLTGLCQDAATEIEQMQAEIESLKANLALYKMAEDAVTIGLSYNDWPKIGCVNHDCDKCKAVQEPVAWAVVGEGEWGEWVIGQQFETNNPPNHEYWENRGYLLVPIYTTPPAAQKPWVGLSEDEINKLRHLVDWTAEWSYGRFAYELERLLREKNGGAA